MRTNLLSLLALLILLMSSNALATGVYLDFNDFPTTNEVAHGVPGSSSTWTYSSGVTNNYPLNSESTGSGWLTGIQSDGLHWFFVDYADFQGICYSHMGVDTYGYLSITDSGHSGKALKHTITGGLPISDQSGACPNSPAGTPLYNLESYGGLSDVYTGGNIGISYIYFHRLTNTGASQRVTTPYALAANANRMYAYVYLPSATTNGTGGYNNPLLQTYEMGLFINGNSTGAHHYFNFYTQGGGWTKMQIEETTNGDNNGNGATRYIPGMIKGDGGNLSSGLWQWYMTTQPYSGIATPPYSVTIDDIGFENDTYTPQNNETISNIAVLYKGSTKTWEISFNDKYKNTADAQATYQVKYSLSGPITNENWSSATPVQVTADSRFYIQARNDGKFQKWWPYYQGVWAPFTLTTTDTNSLTAGQTVYFAIKDVSQVNNTTTPTDGINGYWGTSQGGRKYATNSAFNYTTDSAAIPYIKRISYTLASSFSDPVINGSCGTSNGQSFASMPSTNLCSAGTASSVSGSGPWSWSCAGSGGGSTASCSASLMGQTVAAHINGRITGSFR